MKALDKTTLEKQYSETQAAYEAIQSKIVKLQAEQATLHRALSRIKLNIQTVGIRPVPTYAPWLPMNARVSV